MPLERSLTPGAENNSEKGNLGKKDSMSVTESSVIEIIHPDQRLSHLNSAIMYVRSQGRGHTTTSWPYFGVKLNCVCLMFAYRKK